MMKFSTYTIDEEGTMWGAEPIYAIGWSDAECQAQLKGVCIMGRMHTEEVTDAQGNTQIIDYDIIQNN